MSTIATAKLGREQGRPERYDRVFYSGISIAMALTVFIGFAPTYYSKLFADAPLLTFGRAPFTSLVHLHGILFTTWTLLFVVQTALVAQHRVAIHRKLGVLGGLLAGAMIVAGTATAIKAAAAGSAPAGVSPLSFLAIPLTDMVLFGGFVATALWMRRNKEAHKRLMLLAFVSILTAAVARFPGVLPQGPFVFFGLTFIFLLIAVAYDIASRRRIHPVYLWGVPLLVASVPLRLMLSSTGIWRTFAETITK
jgi:hypothetical protein